VALAPPIAAIAPEPFVPVVLTPEKLIAVMDDAMDCDSVAVTVTPVRGTVAKARQISVVPLCALVRFTSVQMRPPPAMLLTVVFVPLLQSVATKASRSSFARAVLKVGVAMVVLEEELSLATATSAAI
jgi:hypothetical protein